MKIFSFLLILIMFFTPIQTKAVIPLPFGGQIVGIFPCTCSANWILFIRDVRVQALPLVYQPGVTFLHKMYQPRPAVNSLGRFIPGTGVCMIYVGVGCSPVPNAGMMIQLGTSLSIGV